MEISEAYAVLGSPQKRVRYDKDTQHADDRLAQSSYRRSHSSSTTPFGSRPASGLSRRRTQCKGPPPSFYRSGEWGQHGSRRQAQASTAKSAATKAYGRGIRPGQGQSGLDNDVPHFNQEGHTRGQEQQDRRRRRRSKDDDVEYVEGGSLLVKFALCAAVVTFAFSIPGWLDTATNRRRSKNES